MAKFFSFLFGLFAGKSFEEQNNSAVRVFTKQLAKLDAIKDRIMEDSDKRQKKIEALRSGLDANNKALKANLNLTAKIKNIID